MGHLSLIHFAGMHPHTHRLRRREARKLPAIRPSARVEMWYRGELGRIVKLLRAAGDRIAAELRPAATALTGDARPPALPELIAREAGKFGGVAEHARKLSALAVQQELEGVDDALIAAIRRSIGVDVAALMTGHDHELVLAMGKATRDNVGLITSIPRKYFGSLEKAITKSWTPGMRWEDLAGAVRRIGQVTERRARFIARDQVAKMNSAFNRVRQTGLGIERYIWSDSHDKRVRHSHHALNGQACEWKNPPKIEGEPLNPGEDYNCRCVAIPVINLAEIERGFDVVKEAA